MFDSAKIKVDIFFFRYQTVDGPKNRQVKFFVNERTSLVAIRNTFQFIFCPKAKQLRNKYAKRALWLVDQDTETAHPWRHAYIKSIHLFNSNNFGSLYVD